MSKILYVGNDMLVSFSGAGKLLDEKGAAVTGATVGMTLYEAGTTTVVKGETWPVTLVDDGEGEYSATLQDKVEITVGSKYDLKITVDGCGAQATWQQRMAAKVRKFDN